MITFWPSPAKLNLFLYITGQRNDGYHFLQTLFQFLNYGDTIVIKIRKDKKINFKASNFLIKKDNLVVRAVYLLIKEISKINHPSLKSGVDIIINKRLPVGSGLGGGSSNASTVLVALNYLWKCGLTEDKLAAIGLTLGADIPVFIRGSAAFASGIGEYLLPAKPKEKWYLVIYPRIRVSTPLIFKDPELPRNTPKRPIDLLLECEFRNDCEFVVRKRFQEVDRAFCWLSKYAKAHLTGTGSCIFSEFNTESSAYQIFKKMPKWISGFVAKGMNISPLKHTIMKNVIR